MGYLREAMEVLQERNIKVSPQEVLGEGAGCHGGGCPGSAERKIPAAARKGVAPAGASLKGTLLKGTPMSAELTHWPVQLNLVSPMASFLEDADLLIAADCVPFAYPDFHRGLLAGKVLVVGCPKLDNTQAYREKLTQIFTHRNIRSVTYAHMEVPCCFGLIPVIEEALAASGKEIPFSQVTVSIQGELIDE